MSRRRTLAAASLLAMTLASCGDGQNGQATAPAAGAATEAAATQADAAPAAAGAGRPAAVAGSAPAGATVVPAPAKVGLLIDPGDDALGWLAADWLRLDLPLEEWAAERVDKRWQVDEFNADEARVRELAQLRDARSAAAGVGRLRLTLRGALSEYDADYGEYYLKAFSPGSVFTFRPFQGWSANPFARGITLRLRNGGEASIWEIDPATAQKVADTLGYGRNVRMETKLSIVDVTATDRGAEILADVTGYTLYSRDGERLGRWTPGGTDPGGAKAP